MSNQSFFEAMGIAGLERIHTQMLFWVISNENIDKKARSNILNCIFKKDGKDEYNNIYCMTEFKNIDFLVRADEYLFVLENKVASLQHDHQLSKYQKEIEKNIGKRTKGVFFCPPITSDNFVSYRLLSLIGEEAENKKWKNITYEDLYEAFKNNQGRLIDKRNPSVEVLVNEYVDSLSCMVKAFNQFKKSFKDFPCIFQKENKDIKTWYLYDPINYPYKNEWDHYVAIQNLETIFQKYLFSFVGKQMNRGDFYLDDSHARALIEFKLREFDGDYDNTTIKYMIGLQYQGNSAKMLCRPLDQKTYRNTKKDNLPKKILEWFNKASAEINPPKGYKITLNKDGNIKHAFISISLNRHKKIVEFDNYETLVQQFAREYDLIQSYISKHFNELL